MATVASFEVTYIQYLNEENQLSANAPLLAKDQATLLALYRVMVRTRLFDKKAIALQRTGKMGTYAPINGQEAIGTATLVFNAKPKMFYSLLSRLCCQLQRGVNMTKSSPIGVGMNEAVILTATLKDLPICVPIASQCLHATGVAFAFKYRNEPRVAVTCIGDGGTSEGDFYEALNVAGAWNYLLSLLLIITNGQYQYRRINKPLLKRLLKKLSARRRRRASGR